MLAQSLSMSRTEAHPSAPLLSQSHSPEVHQQRQLQPLSTLTREEHINYLRLDSAHKHGHPLSPYDKSQYEHLIPRVNEELELFRLSQTNIFIQRHAFPMRNMPRNIMEIVKRIMSQRRNRVYTQYPVSFARSLEQIGTFMNAIYLSKSTYTLLDKINLPNELVLPGDPLLVFSKELLKLGTCWAFEPPTNHPPIDIDTSIDPFVPSLDRDRWFKKAWLRDDCCFLHALENDADIVISSGALTALAALQFSNCPDIPVVIRELNVDINGVEKRRKVAFIDKPLLQKCVTLRECAGIYHSAVFKSMFYKMTPKSSVNFGEYRKKMPSVAAPTESNNGLPDNVSYNLWNLGDLKILIRCKIDGHYPEIPQQSKFVSIKTKMEYQTDEGFERLTTEERARFQFMDDR
ncbi:hypothetical protein HK104_005809 [Borealophlyctis nickersoniae]|nr:hypothetical protein HK104_005809 [Borealophlyctis nickersoniae]